MIYLGEFNLLDFLLKLRADDCVWSDWVMVHASSTWLGKDRKSKQDSTQNSLRKRGRVWRKRKSDKFIGKKLVKKIEGESEKNNRKIFEEKSEKEGQELRK
jgi:hypothetical protein